MPGKLLGETGGKISKKTRWYKKTNLKIHQQEKLASACGGKIDDAAEKSYEFKVLSENF